MSETSAKPASRLWWRNGVIWAALNALLFLSLGAAYLPMGRWTTVAGLVIALVKAGLVAILFMQLGKSGALTRLAALAGLIFLGVLFTLTFADVLTRV